MEFLKNKDISVTPCNTVIYAGKPYHTKYIIECETYKDFKMIYEYMFGTYELSMIYNTHSVFSDQYYILHICDTESYIMWAKGDPYPQKIGLILTEDGTYDIVYDPVDAYASTYCCLTKFHVNEIETLIRSLWFE